MITLTVRTVQGLSVQVQFAHGGGSGVQGGAPSSVRPVRDNTPEPATLLLFCLLLKHTHTHAHFGNANMGVGPSCGERAEGRSQWMELETT